MGLLLKQLRIGRSRSRALCKEPQYQDSHPRMIANEGRLSMSFDRLADYAIGLKLRALRTGRNTTLAQLAAETGLSTGLLSKLETDRMIPTLQTLERISRAYGIDLGYFFCKPQNLSVSITRRAQYDDRKRGSIPLHIPTAEGTARLSNHRNSCRPIFMRSRVWKIDRSDRIRD